MSAIPRSSLILTFLSSPTEDIKIMAEERTFEKSRDFFKVSKLAKQPELNYKFFVSDSLILRYYHQVLQFIRRQGKWKIRSKTE